jgi:hypothetical protein
VVATNASVSERRRDTASSLAALDQKQRRQGDACVHPDVSPHSVWNM